jgi:DNA polymerase-3 subunit alpha
MSYADVDRIAKMIPFDLKMTLDRALEESPPLLEAYQKDPRVKELVDISRRLEGTTRHASTHAAGVVIAPRPLTEFVPLFKGTTADITTQFDMKGIERVGLLKMDFLGLRTLTLIDDCVKMIAAQTGERLEPDHLPIDDPKTFALFTSGRTSGLFQFESEGMRDILKRFKPDRIEHLTALNALYRPGPMQMIEDFIRRRHGQTRVSFEHPALAPILTETYGVMVYQEQVMQIAVALAGFTMGEADILRKAMGKKKAEVMAAQMEKFLGGCTSRGIAAKVARKIWDHMEQFAGYGFNKSHSAAYALLAYQTAYLKANYPVFFMAALLTSERGSSDKIVHYMGECREMGIRVLPPDVNVSDIYFTVVPGAQSDIRFGLAAIKNVGEGAVQAVLKARRESGAFRSIFDLCDRVDLRAVNRRVLESLVKSGSFDATEPRRAALYNGIDRAMDAAQKHQRDVAQGQASLFGAIDGSGHAGGGQALPSTPEWGEGERLSFEKESLGFFITGHPLERFRAELDELEAIPTSRRLERGDQEVRVGGIVSALRLIKTKKGDRMASFVLEDLEGGVESLVFPETYRRFASRIADELVVFVKGRCEVLEESRARLLVSEVMSLDQARIADARGVRIRIPLAGWDRVRGERLRDILEGHPGDCPVLLEIRDPGSAVMVAPRVSCRVRPSEALRDAVEAVLGSGALVVDRASVVRRG